MIGALSVAVLSALLAAWYAVSGVLLLQTVRSSHGTRLRRVVGVVAGVGMVLMALVTAAQGSAYILGAW